MKQLLLIFCCLSTFAGTAFASGDVTGITPNHGQAGTSLTVSLSGQNAFFNTGTTTVWLSQGTSTIINASSVTYKGSDSASAYFNISSSAQTGVYDVNVENSYHGIYTTLANGFSVTYTANPHLTSVSPSSAKQGQTLSVSLSGQNTNFTTGTCTVWFSQGTTTYVTPSSVTVNNDNSVSASFSIPSNATLGTYDVTVADDYDGFVTSKSAFVIYAVHSLKGKISTSTGVPLTGSWVYALQVNKSDSTVKATDSTQTDASGNYNFADMNNWSPYIYAMPDSSNFPNELPTYYDTTAYLNNATQITLYGGSNTLSFSTLYGANPGGSGFIGGKISYCTICKKSGSVASLKVILTNASGAIQHVTYTDANGNFSFGNLSLQKYMIRLDMHGIDNSNAPSLDLSSSSPGKSKLKFVLYPNSLAIDTTAGISSENEQRFNASVYPNPFGTSLGLQYTLEKSSVVYVKLYDATGREVFRTNEERQSSGQHSMSINALSSIPAGIYLLELHVDGFLVHKNVVKY